VDGRDAFSTQLSTHTDSEAQHCRAAAHEHRIDHARHATYRVGDEAEPAHGVLFPYRWIRDRIVVSPYQLISRNVLAAQDFASPQIKSDVEGLLKMYEMRGSMANRFGTVVRRRDGIGDRFARKKMRLLHRAVVAALLDPMAG
jgi:hypothetical protein